MSLEEHSFDIWRFNIDTTAYDDAKDHIKKYSNLASDLESKLSTCEERISEAENYGTSFYTVFTRNAGCATGDMETMFTSKVSSWNELRTTVLTKMKDAYDTATQRKSAAESFVESWTEERDSQETSIKKQIKACLAEEARKEAEASS